jgi:hypothetical protein
MTKTLNTWGRLGTAAVAVAMLSGIISAATRGPDPAGYTATDATVYSFIDLAGGGGASILDDTDDGTAALTLPFPFQFYGAPRTLLCVSSNGAAYFVADVPACAGIVDFANTDLSVTASPGDTPGLFPFWSDLTFDQSGAGSVLYQTLGTTGSRRFVIQWQNAYPSGSSSPVTFQLVLAEGTSQTLFQYKTVDLGSENPATKGGTATVGVRNAGALISGQQIQWSFGVPVIANESAVLFAGPSSGAHMFGAGSTMPPNAQRQRLFTVDVTDSPAGGTVGLEDQTQNVVFASTSITGVTRQGSTMSISGAGTVNGVAGYTFVATASDNPDRFGIVIRRTGQNGVFYNAPEQAVTTGSLTLQ